MKQRLPHWIEESHHTPWWHFWNKDSGLAGAMLMGFIIAGSLVLTVWIVEWLKSL